MIISYREISSVPPGFFWPAYCYFCLICSNLACDAFLSITVLPYFCNPSFNLNIKSQSAIRLNSFIICEKRRKWKSNVTSKKGKNEFNMKFPKWHNCNISETIYPIFEVFIYPFFFLSFYFFYLADFDNKLELGRVYFCE